MKSFPHNPDPSKNTQKGSALFIILIGVVLFAALSYSVAQMMRGGSPTAIAEEKARLYSDEILNYARSLRQAAQSMKISSGCKDTDISFENTTVAGYAHVPPVADTCKVFNTSGGAMNYLVPAEEWLDQVYSPAPALRGQWFFPANTCVPGTGSAPAAGCNADGDDDEAVIVVLPYVRKEVCIQLNKALGVGTPGDDPPQESGNAWPAGATKFTGSFADGEQIDVANHVAGCFEGLGLNAPPAKTYHFFQVLMPR